MSAESSLRPLGRAAVLLGWCAAPTLLGTPTFLPVMAALAAGTAGFLYITDRPQLGPLLVPRPRDLAMGLAAGIGMVGLTHPAYALLTSAWAGLRPLTVELYGGVQIGRAPALLVLSVPFVALVEEVLWRGAVLSWLSVRMPVVRAASIALIAYAVSLLVSGAWLLAGVALACGLCWTLLRLLTGRLWAPALAHVIWTFGILRLWPLERLSG